MPPFQEKKVDGSVMRSLHQARQLRQGHGHCRDVSDQQQAADDGDIVHEHVRQDLFQAGTAHLDADEQRVADRGRDVADAEVVHEDHTKVDGAHAKALADGQEQRGEDQDRRGNIHKGAGHQQDDVHDQEDDVLVVGQAQQQSRHGIGDLQERHDPAQNVGHANEEDNHAGHLGRIHNDLPQTLEVDGAVAECQDESVDHGDGRTLGGGEDAAHDATDDHDDQGEGGQSAQGADAEVLPIELAGGPLIAQLLGQDDADHGAGQSPDDAGDITGHEQGSHGGAAGSQRVSDQGVGGRDQQAGAGGGRIGSSGDSRVIALLLGTVADHGANGSSRSGSRAGDGAEQGVGADVGHQQCAGHLAQNGHDEIHQTLGDAALIHDVAGQNKERDGGQAELAHAHKGALGSGQHGHIQVNGRKDGSQGRDCNGVRDGHAEEQQHQQHCQNYE